MKLFIDSQKNAVRRGLIGAASGLVLLLLCFFAKRATVGIGFLFFFCGSMGLLVCLWSLSTLPFSRKWLRRLGKAFRTVAAVGFCLFVVLCISFETSISRYAVTDATDGAKYMIVYGAGVNGTVPSAILYERIDAAEEYLKSNPDTVAVLSGSQGTGEDISEADAMYTALTERGISSEQLIKEEKAGNTVENTEFSLALLKEMGYTESDSLVLVTNDFHCYRVRRIATGLGAENVTSVAADMPKLPLFDLTYHLREYFSLGKQMLTEIFGSLS